MAAMPRLLPRMAAVLILSLHLIACAGQSEPPDPIDVQMRRALDRGMAYLESQQRSNGSWRSESYAVHRDGWALTPLALKPLGYAPNTLATLGSWAKGRHFLQGILDEAGNVDPTVTLSYPVYTASLTIAAMSRAFDEDSAALREACAEMLLAHQLNERLGWQTDDAAFGGWGYSARPLQRPADGAQAPMFDADLSSTLFALGALRLAGVSADDPAIQDALVFVERCQNFTYGQASEFDDGGFFFTPTSDGPNKAGIAGSDAAGRTRFRSYGSMTADGLRALLRCGLSTDDARVVAARSWLDSHFDATANPGDFPEARRTDQASAYFYYAWSYAHAVRLMDTGTMRAADATAVEHRRALAESILDRQRADGSWANEFSAMQEDDPIIATSLALGALGALLELEAQ